MKILLRAFTLVLVLCLVGLGALVYRRSAPPEAPATTSRQQDAPGGGEFSSLTPKLPAPELGFTTRTGEPVRLADFRGHVVLVNLWATWCGPCVEEMPSLDRMQAQLGHDLTVLAISEDRNGESVVAPFLARIESHHLAVYLDPSNAALRAFGVHGLPTSFLISRDGTVLAKIEGSAEWDDPAMIATLRSYLPSPAPAMEKTELTR